MNSAYKLILEPKTSNGIDKLDLMIALINFIEASEEKMKDEFDKLKHLLTKHIKRNLTAQEELELSQGILNCIESSPQPKERNDAMEFLIEAKFIKYDKQILIKTNSPNTQK
jgi:hypothetical protein